MTAEEATHGNHPTACGLYIHIPFCETKCGYCDFFSVAVKQRDTAGLVERIIRELHHRLTGDRPAVSTVFCGGGTPTILPVDELAGLLGVVAEHVPIHDLEEFTVEGNPATIDDAKADLLVDGGVTRVSLGAQSFYPEELATLERLHSPDDIAPSVEVLRRSGVRQLNLDLIFGIPGQTMETWAGSLRRAVDLGPNHVACYGLTYEPGTRLTAQRNTGRITPSDENLEADMYLFAIDSLADAGYEQYETSNFAKPGCRCRHNVVYWHNGPYIGVGPSAVGCIDRRRYKNVADVAGYVRMIDSQGHAEAETEVVDTAMLMTEMIMMQLRLVEGLSIADFSGRTGVNPVQRFAATLTRLVDLGFLTVSNSHIALTRDGRLVGDAVMAELAGACDEDAACEHAYA